MQKRIEYLDIVKVIAIFLVVFCHFVLLAQTVPANLFMSACWSGVPMFFLVNGALLFTRPLKLKKHISKTLAIYLILVVWRLIYLLSIGAILHVPFSGFGKGQIFLYLFAFGNLDGIGTGHLWFIEALLAVYLLFPLFRICFDHPFGRGLILFFAIYVVYTAVLSLTAFFARVHTIDLRLTLRDVLKAVGLCVVEVSCLRFVMAWVRMTALIGYRKKKHTWGQIQRHTINVE